MGDHKDRPYTVDQSFVIRFSRPYYLHLLSPTPFSAGRERLQAILTNREVCRRIAFV